ncbi:cadherin-like domain-containing protein [Pseudoalteromonas sp. MMG010]|uniref:cadherin-like domain-containing protein n=1 Tax=Pseudoalteromonas sp. MMG010 TaxID=2822685 RepID=UPI001B3A60A4|nr:cadherin-like domain-containing protein [Pseudoalteromonas sp. MMG010]MBQ4832120.1 cadherin-like domain-containing protein [Pseudoalteromonas sp. MMG010]
MKTSRTLLALAITSTLTACGGGSDNSAPEFSQVSYSLSTSEDTAVEGSVSATDAKSYTVVNAASNGVFSLNADGSFSYSPNADFNGSDSVVVQASDGSQTSQAAVNFTVTAVNDAPTLSTTAINVTTSAQTVATLDVIDVDGDDIVFTLVEAPQSGILTLSSTGEVTYQAEQLSAISGSFVVSYTDGVIEQPIEATIALQAAMVTNQDKLTYYYSSEKSHIAKAQSIKVNIADDATQDTINIDLAASYYFSGFDETGQSTIDEISDVYSKAKAYNASAEALDSRELFDKALELRELAEENYNLYLGEKGLNNINSSDAGFFLGLIRDYLAAGQTTEANRLLTSLKLYADAIREEEYDSTYGSFLTSFDENASIAVATYLSDKTEQNYQLAVEAIQHFAELAEQTGYRIETVSGNYTDEPSDRIKGVYLSYAITHFYNIDAEEETKEYMAKLLALYGEVNYDEDYVYELGEYVDATRDHRTSYMFAISELSGIFARYYPTAEVNIPIKLVDEFGSSFYQSSARENLYSSTIISDVIAGNGIEAGVASATTYYSDDFYLRGLFETLIESYSGDGAAIQLANLGYTSSALEILGKVSDLIISDSYINQQWSDVYVTGRSGCFRVTELTMSYGGDAQAQAQVCETLVNDYYGVDSGIATSDIISTQNHLLHTYAVVGDSEKVSAIADVMLTQIAILDDLEEQTEAYLDLANSLLKYAVFTKSKTVLDLALANIDTLIATDDTTLIEAALGYLELYLLNNGTVSNTSLGYDSYIYGVKANAINITDYVTFYQNAVESINSRVTSLTTKVLTLSDNDIQNMMEDLVKINFYSGQTTKVIELIAHDVNGDADKLALNANFAQYYTSYDDFPGSTIASVDTDHDGFPNFFMLDVSDDDIAASGLVLDEDSDNDGIVDTQDDTPLGD